jgi:hypothetical protein
MVTCSHVATTAPNLRQLLADYWGEGIMDTMISAAALAVALVSLGLSFYFWRRSFRPIVTVAVKTNSGGNVMITYDLVVLNSGTIPAKNIRIIVSEDDLVPAFGQDATDANRRQELSCFDAVIEMLQNGDKTSCSFGTTKANDGGFWRYNSVIPITLHYEGWFGKKYSESQRIRIVDSDSFTGYYWGAKGSAT